jgi:ribosomal protein S27AE
VGSLLSERSPSPQEAQTYPSSAATLSPSSALPQQAPQQAPQQDRPQQDRLTTAPQETCPQCSSRLGPPLKSSGRQVCAKCGWTDKPKGTISQKSEASRLVTPTAASLADYELKKLLDQAASESLNNMKPKRKQDQQPHKQLPLEDEGKQ